jgi:superfamily II DNA or RNA helicase
MDMAEQNIRVVYNFFELLPGLFSVNAFFVKRDASGVLTHIIQKATAPQLEAFPVPQQEIHQRLLRTVDQIQVKGLEAYFNGKKKKPVPLASLVEDEAIKKQLEVYVHRRVDELLSLVEKYQLDIAWDAERKSLVKDMVLQFGPTTLQPMLSFRRESDGILYRLRLKGAGEAWTIQSKEVVSLCNEPAWIRADDCLYRVDHINGHMVLPFRNKDELRIPAGSVKTYFQRFILRVASRADIEAQGFDVVQHEDLLACRLEPRHDLFGGKWTLAVYMHYQGADFACFDARQERTSLEFGDQQEVMIVKVKRHTEKEDWYLQLLETKGLIPGNGSQFVVAQQEDHPHALLQWLCEHRAALELEGFRVLVPELENGKLLLDIPTISMEPKQGNDWFDIYGEIRVGPYLIYFVELAPFIRTGNRFFPLPDGFVFMIPEEWMTKYKGLAQMGKKQDQALRINRSQFTLLQELGMQSGPSGQQDPTTEEIALPDTLKATLRPYQLEGYRWLVRHYRDQLGCCLADDMGLGKTLQTIAALLYAKAQKTEGVAVASGPGPQLSLFQTAQDADFLKPLNALIVLPASLVFNWQAELNQFAPSLFQYVHTGPGRHKDIRLLARYDIVLTTYQTALRDEELLQKMAWEYIVLDESQQIKNRDSQVFKSLNTLHARHKLSLSGTPIENSLSDLWSQMQFINPELLGGFPFFQKEFLLPIERQQDEHKKSLLRGLVQPYLLRRTKEEVAKDLPPLTERIYYSEMTAEQEKLYEREKSKARNYLLDNYRSGDGQYQVIMHQTLMRLRQIVNHPAMVLEEYDKDSGKFRDVLEELNVIRKSGHKVLMFSSFVKYLELFRQAWADTPEQVAWLTGQQSSKEREAEVHRFQHDPAVQTFLISIKAGGTGLNLTAADYVFVLDPWWNPFVERQAVARAHRIGQQNNVIALKFITRNSIEEKILILQERKKALAEEIIASPDKISLDRADLEYLLS